MRGWVGSLVAWWKGRVFVVVLVVGAVTERRWIPTLVEPISPFLPKRQRSEALSANNLSTWVVWAIV